MDSWTVYQRNRLEVRESDASFRGRRLVGVTWECTAGMDGLWFEEEDGEYADIGQEARDVG